MRKQSYPIVLICLIFRALPLTAQDLHVYFDAFKDSLYYMQNGKIISSPQVREGAKVFFHIDNYNNYLYELNLEIENKEILAGSFNAGADLKSLLPSSGAAFNPLDLLFSGGGDQLLGGLNMFPGLSGSDLQMKKSGFGVNLTLEEQAHNERVEKIKKAEKTFDALRERIMDLDRELSAMESEASAKIDANRLQLFAADEIAKLRYNPKLEPKQIKQLCGEYMQRIFQESDPNKISLEQVLKTADAQKEIGAYVKRYQDKVNRYAQEANACQSVVKEFKKFQFPNSNLDAFTLQTESFTQSIQQKLNAYQGNAQMLEEKLGTVETLDPRSLAALRTTYLELSNNPFAKNLTHTAKGEKMMVNFKLTPNDSLRQVGMKEHSTPLEISVYGGLRVKASVGLSFGQFFKRPQQYFIRDSILQSSPKDAFSPILTSFIHFYAASRKSVSLAGSFGVGFPIGGGESLQSVSFFAGPSLVFGKNGRIIMSGGIMGSKTDRLSEGYQVGDTFFSDSNDAPVNSVYELGYFLGFSFNLTGN